MSLLRNKLITFLNHTDKELDINLLLRRIVQIWQIVTSGHFLISKHRLHGKKLEPREELRCAINRALQEIPLDGLLYVFQSWVRQWNKCKFCQGHNFET